MNITQLAQAIRDALASGKTQAQIHSDMARLGYSDRQIHEATLTAKNPVFQKNS